jgi:peptidoglycan/LPS O-acetylase OafA/YrhL
MLIKVLNKISFNRITTSGIFIPEIDGLRFIAISSVVLYHLNGFLSEKDLTSYKSNYFINLIESVFKQGHIGVPLFFVISGFILGIPFAKHFINKEPKVIISEYFKRRLTRLEPRIFCL